MKEEKKPLPLQFCINCNWSEIRQFQDERGNPLQGLLCTHALCRDVIEGNPIPALAARQQPLYCGFEARYFKPKEEVAKVLTLVK